MIIIGIILLAMSLIGNAILIWGAFFHNPAPKWSEVSEHECACCGTDVTKEETTGLCCPECRCSKHRSNQKWWRKTL